MLEREREQLNSTHDLELLLGYGDAIAQEENSEGVCRRLTDVVASSAGFPLVSVALLPGHQQDRAAVYGVFGKSPLEVRLQDVIARLAEEGWPGTDRISEMPSNRLPDEISHLGIKRLWRTDVQSHHGLPAVLIVGSDGNAPMGPALTMLLANLAATTRAALDSVSLRHTIDSHECEGALAEVSQRLRALNTAVHEVNVAGEVETIADTLAGLLVERFNVEACGILLYQAEDDTLEMWAHRNLPEELLSAYRRFYVTGFHNEVVIREGTPNLHNDCRTVPGFAQLGIDASWPNWGSYLCIPLMAGDQPVGVVGLFSRHPRVFSSEEVNLFSLLGQQAGVALQRRRAEAAVHEERNRLAREIHDTLAQGLTGIVWQLNAAIGASTGDRQATNAYIERARTLARDSLQEARRAITDLRPSPLQSQTLAQALERETIKAGLQQVGINATFSISGRPRELSSKADAALFRICQESLANVLNHSRASEVAVNLDFQDAQVRLTVKDNGVGFQPEGIASRGSDSGGFGLTNMKERAQLVGGVLSVSSQPGNGTAVSVVLNLS